MFRMIGHIILGVVSWSVSFGIGIDAEDREIAGLTRPHPVVCLATELTHRLGNGKDQTQVGEIAISGNEVTIALIERLQFQT